MIIKKSEVDRLRSIIEKSKNSNHERRILDFLVENPHLLVATRYFNEYTSCLSYLGFERNNLTSFEKRGYSFWSHLKGLDAKIGFFRQPNGLWLYAEHLEEASVKFCTYSHWVNHMTSDPSFGALVGSEDEPLSIDFEDLLNNLDVVQKNPNIENKYLYSPFLWTPQSQEFEKENLTSISTQLLAELAINKIDLRSIHWKQLEEVVAELLRSHGMEIHMVKESPQGGRDIIARGQIIPGMGPVTMAVEVKQRDVVGRPEIHKALHQNRYFPALLFVTSGRFTAGVIEEQAKPENQLRLFLKDGIALNDLLKLYALKDKIDRQKL